MFKRNVTTNNLIKYRVTQEGLINEDKKHVQMIKIQPVNLFAMRDDDKELYLQNLFHFLNNNDINDIQIFITHEYLNVKTFIDQLRGLKLQYDCRKKQDEKKIQILDDEINNLALIALENEIVNSAYYLIYSYADIEQLYEMNDLITRVLSSTLLIYKMCSLEEQVRLIYKYMNPVRCTYEKFPNSFGKEFDINDFLKIENLEIATDGLFQYIKADNLYQAFLYVAKYPSEPNLGYLNKLTQFTDADVSINLNMRSSHRVIKEYDDTAQTLAEDMDKPNVKYSQVISINKEIDVLQRKLEEVVAEDIKSCTIFATIRLYAETIDDLNFKITRAKEIAGRNLFLLRNGFYEQLALFKSNTPLSLNHYFSETYATDVTTKTVGYGFPFIQEELIDAYQPIYLGKTITNGLVLYSSDVTDFEKLNRNEFFGGPTGVGKTFLILNLIHHRFARSQKQFIIDVEGNQLKNWAIDNGGTIVDCSNGINGIINPLQIRIEYQRKISKSNEDQKAIDEEIYNMETDLEKIYPLANHMLFVRDFWRSLYFNEKDGGVVEMRIKYFDYFLQKLYEKYGFTLQTPATIIKNTTPDKFPIMSDLYNYVNECYQNEDFGIVPKDMFPLLLIDLHTFAFRAESVMFNGHTNVDLNNDIVLFDISSFNTGTSVVLQAHLFNILSYIWNYLLSDDSGQIIRVLIDELSVILKSKNENLIAMLDNLMKRIRKFLGGVTTATQQLNDVLKIEDAKSIITQSQYKIYLSIDDFGAQFLKDSNRYKQDDINFIHLNSQRGKFLFDTGRAKYKVELKLNDQLVEYFDSLKNK